MRFILDTDHLSLHQRAHAPIRERLLTIPPEDVAITVVTIEEQLRGRLAYIRKATDAASLQRSYSWLHETVRSINRFNFADYDEAAHRHFQRLKSLKLCVGTQDLRIAAIALARDCTLVTRNAQDFQAVPRLTLADWSH
jgi:tRNA(fMet)-specific endonuclease VapC